MSKKYTMCRLNSETVDWMRNEFKNELIDTYPELNLTSFSDYVLFDMMKYIILRYAKR